MKSIFTSLTLVLLAFSTFSQPVLNVADIYMENGFSTGRFITGSNVPVNIEGSSGANQTWDFSQLSFTSSPRTTTYRKGGDSFEPNSDRIMFGADTLAKNYLEFINGAVLHTRSGPSHTYNPGLTILKAPYTYGTKFSDSVEVTSGPTGGYATMEAEIDGYGKVITPNKTFNNCIRVRRVRHEFTRAAVETIDTSYSYFSVGVGSELATVSRMSSTYFGIPTEYYQRVYVMDSVTNVNYQPLSIQTEFNNKESFQLYPNPVKRNDQINIKLQNKVGGILRVYSSDGSLVYSRQLKVGLEKCSIGLNCDAGAYTVTLEQNGKIAARMFLVE